MSARPPEWRPSCAQIVAHRSVSTPIWSAESPHTHTHPGSPMRADRPVPRLIRRGRGAGGQDVIANLNIPTSVPLVYQLDDDLKPIKHPQARIPAPPRRAGLPTAGRDRRPFDARLRPARHPETRAPACASPAPRAGRGAHLARGGARRGRGGGRRAAVVCAHVGAVPRGPGRDPRRHRGRRQPERQEVSRPARARRRRSPGARCCPGGRLWRMASESPRT
jgi:hypothetical protein